MTLGCILLSLGIYFFKIPNGFATGGVTGIGTILAKITPISPGVWIWILNILLLFVGFLFLLYLILICKIGRKDNNISNNERANEQKKEEGGKSKKEIGIIQKEKIIFVRSNSPNA